MAPNARRVLRGLSLHHELQQLSGQRSHSWRQAILAAKEQLSDSDFKEYLRENTYYGKAKHRIPMQAHPVGAVSTPARTLQLAVLLPPPGTLRGCLPHLPHGLLPPAAHPPHARPTIVPLGVCMGDNLLHVSNLIQRLRAPEEVQGSVPPLVRHGAGPLPPPGQPGREFQVRALSVRHGAGPLPPPAAAGGSHLLHARHDTHAAAIAGGAQLQRVLHDLPIDPFMLSPWESEAESFAQQKKLEQ